MGWRFTDDVEVYARHVWDVLAARPAENTVALTVIENVRAGRRWSDEAMLFAWYGDDQVSGAASVTPPYELHLAAVPDHSLDGLVGELRAQRVRLPGVNGEAAGADRFAAAWVAGTSMATTTAMRQRLYALHELRAPSPSPEGCARPAVDDDHDLAARWIAAFQAETGTHAVDVDAVVRQRTDAGLLWLWQAADGSAVSLAGRNPTAAGVARVGPVYTPPERRRRGYGAAVTAACTSDALGRDASQVVLFTDLANPTSNAIYQQIGYRPVSDHTVIRFAG